MTRPDMSLKLSSLLSGLGKYSPPQPRASVDLRLDSNEGPMPPSWLLDEAAGAGTELIRRYPDAASLERRISAMIGVDPRQVVVTAGADDAIERAVRMVLAPGREIILPVPTFEMLEIYPKMTGCRIVEVPWLEGGFPVEAVLRAVNERTSLIAVVTPNNPTGLSATAADLDRLSRGAPDALLLVDLAYADFAGTDLTLQAIGLPNAIVARSMSKAWGIAGLRVGFAAGRPEIIDWMRTMGHPYAVSSLSLRLAEAHLERGGAGVALFVERVKRERAALWSLLRDLGAEALPSDANFVLGRFRDAEWVREALLSLGIAVRIFPGRPLLDDCLRISLPGDDGVFARLVGALRTVLAPEAILFDIDDTMADVTESYRQATLATAGHFGHEATPADITAAKAAGNANNDWELTWRLVRSGGIDVSLAEVTERFEDLYQGRDGRPGLHERETLLADRGLFERLAARFKLGAVTGRPRRDAHHFLERQGIAGLFGTVVAMEDAPPKPDPASVRLAMERLGASRAWMVGDTPDDVRAAMGAGAVPIGVIAPADDPKIARPALVKAGAARILARLAEIEEILK
jgi:histidinol-phosphate aminotransferase